MDEREGRVMGGEDELELIGKGWIPPALASLMLDALGGSFAFNAAEVSARVAARREVRIIHFDGLAGARAVVPWSPVIVTVIEEGA